MSLRALKRLVLPAAAAVLAASCMRFVKLGSELDFMERTYVVTGRVEGAEQFPRLYGLVVDWDRTQDKVLSFDRTRVGNLGVFAFFVGSREHQYVAAYSDTNSNEAYDEGEPLWTASDAHGMAVPLEFDLASRRAPAVLKRSTRDASLGRVAAAARVFRGERTTEEAATKWSIPIALGDLADLDDARFSAVRGEEGLWRPASFPRDSGSGVFFLEPYDPRRVPVLFVYGAGGSPQDWRLFFAHLDRTKYQAWFYLYPTGWRLEGSGLVLNAAVELLQAHYRFERLHVVAHSMGGMVARAFLLTNVLDDHQRYVHRFATISTPWAGHEKAAMGVKFGPAVVPSWRDMVTGSPFQKQLFARSLTPDVDHLLIYGQLAGHDGDGTVSIASQLLPQARKSAVAVVGYEADHVGILSRPEVLRTVQEFLDGKVPATP